MTKIKINQYPNVIYSTPDSWGEKYYFIESEYNRFINEFINSGDYSDIDMPEILSYDPDDNFYYSEYFQNFGTEFYQLLTDDDPSDIKLKFLGVKK